MTNTIEEILAMNKEDAIDELYEMCQELHGCDCTECPVYEVNNEVPNNEKSRWGCDCFKNGQKILSFIS